MPELDRLPRPVDRLARFIDRLAVPPGDQYDWTLWIEAWSQALRSPAVCSGAERTIKRLADLLASVVRDGQAAGDFEPTVDPEDFVLSLIAMLDGLGISVRLGILGMTRERTRSLALRFARTMLRCDLEPVDDGEPEAHREVVRP
jgi:hypothetical protein